MDIIVGRTYAVNHPRQGLFSIKVRYILDMYVTGTIVKGTAQLKGQKDRGPGSEITVNKHLCVITQLD